MLSTKKNVPALYSEIREIVSSEVAKMTDLEIVEINVNVVDIKTKEQHEADSVSLQDRVSDVAESTGEFTSEQFEKKPNLVLDLVSQLFKKS